MADFSTENIQQIDRYESLAPDPKLVEVLSQKTPKEVFMFVINNPPPIKVKDAQAGETLTLEPKITLDSAPQEDRELSRREIPAPTFIPERFQERIARHIKKTQDFLASPTIKDDFNNDHTKRRAWERGILNALNEIDESSGNDLEDKNNYANTFKRKLDRNKLGKSGYLKPHNLMQMLVLATRDTLDPKAKELMTSVKNELIPHFDNAYKLQHPQKDTSEQLIEEVALITKDLLTKIEQSNPDS